MERQCEEDQSIIIRQNTIHNGFMISIKDDWLQIGKRRLNGYCWSRICWKLIYAFRIGLIPSSLYLVRYTDLEWMTYSLPTPCEPNQSWMRDSIWRNCNLQLASVQYTESCYIHNWWIVHRREEWREYTSISHIYSLEWMKEWNGSWKSTNAHSIWDTTDSFFTPNHDGITYNYHSFKPISSYMSTRISCSHIANVCI